MQVAPLALLALSCIIVHMHNYAIVIILYCISMCTFYTGFQRCFRCCDNSKLMECFVQGKTYDTKLLFLFLQSLTSRHACIILWILWHGYGMAMLVALSLFPSVANCLQQFSAILLAGAVHGVH